MSGNFDGERFDHIARSDWDDERSRLMAEQERLLRLGVPMESLARLDAMGIPAGVVSAAVEEFGLSAPVVPVGVRVGQDKEAPHNSPYQPVGVQPEPAERSDIGTEFVQQIDAYGEDDWPGATWEKELRSRRAVPVVHPEPGDPARIRWSMNPGQDETSSAVRRIDHSDGHGYWVTFDGRAIADMWLTADPVRLEVHPVGAVAAAVAAVRADTALTLETKAHGRPMYDLAVVESARQQAFMEAAAIVRGES